MPNASPGFPSTEERGTCKVCGEPAFHRQSIYCAEHRPASAIANAEKAAARTAKKKGKTEAPRARPATPVAAVSAAVHQGEPTGAARTKPPTAQEWRERLGMALAMITIWLALRVIARSDIREAPEEVQDQACDKLSMGDDEVDAIIDPVVALITGPLGKVNKKYGRQSLELLGILPAALGLITWRSRVREFERLHCPPKPARGRQRAQPAREDVAEAGEAFPYLNGAQAFEPEGGLVGPHPG